MENASKALIIAGGILISMLVISIGVYLFASYGDVSSSHDENMEAIEIQKFNVNFTKFEGRNDITIHEIITLVNFARQYNQDAGIDIEVYLKNYELKDKPIIELIEKYSNEYFKCTNIDDEDKDGRIDSISFMD